MAIGKYITILVVIGVLIYFNSLFNGFVWDDEEQVLNNTAVHSIGNFFQFFSGSTFNTGGSGGLAGLYYKPMMSVFFSLLYTVSGASAFLFHLFQLSLHISSAILVFIFFKSFFKEKISFFLAVIFLIHPINTETVVYVSALQDALFFFFGMVALLIMRSLPKIKSYILVTCLLLLSLLSKETGGLFVLILPIYAFFFQRKKLLSSVICSFAALGAYLFLRFLVAGIYFSHEGLSPIMRTTFIERLVNIPQIIFFYLKTFFWPVDLAIAQHWVIKSVTFSNFYLPLAVILILSLIIISAFLYLHHKRREEQSVFVFFILWLILGLGLHIQIFPLDMTVAERWFYLPIVGLLGIIGILLTFLTPVFERFKSVSLAACLIVLIILSVRTVGRNMNWKDGLTLYSHDIAISRNAFDLENNLGVELFRSSKYNEAGLHFKRSTELAPYWWTNWNNLGALSERNGNYLNAVEYYQKAVENGHYYLAYENLAALQLFKMKDPKNAKQFIEKSLKRLPLNQKLWLLLALSEYQLNNTQNALIAAQRAYEILPSQKNYYVYSRLKQNLPLDLQ